jgi:hypothetical protein
VQAKGYYRVPADHHISTYLWLSVATSGLLTSNRQEHVLVAFHNKNISTNEFLQYMGQDSEMWNLQKPQEVFGCPYWDAELHEFFRCAWQGEELRSGVRPCYSADVCHGLLLAEPESEIPGSFDEAGAARDAGQLLLHSNIWAAS